MCDCESPEVFRVTWRVARKPHHCCECGEIILAGTEYEYVSGVWAGTGLSFKTCATCSAVKGLYCDRLDANDCPPCIGGLWDDIVSNGGEAAELLALARGVEPALTETST